MELIKEAKRFQKLAGIIIEADTDEESIDDKEFERGNTNVKLPPDESELKEPTNKPETQDEIPPADTPEEEPGIINRETAKQLIKNTRGKFFTVTFIKKDGTTRVMNARLGVKAFLRGGELPYNPEEKGLIPVYDVQTHDYRMVNVNTIIHLKIGNKEFQVQ